MSVMAGCIWLMVVHYAMLSTLQMGYTDAMQHCDVFHLSLHKMLSEKRQNISICRGGETVWDQEPQVETLRIHKACS